MPELDITNVTIFYTVRKETKTKYKTKIEDKQALKGVKYSEDHKSLVLWSLQNKNDSRVHETAKKARSLMVYRVGETSGEKYA